jgi:hypothetical protein
MQFPPASCLFSPLGPVILSTPCSRTPLASFLPFNVKHQILHQHKATGKVIYSLFQCLSIYIAYRRTKHAK